MLYCRYRRYRSREDHVPVRWRTRRTRSGSFLSAAVSSHGSPLCLAGIMLISDIPTYCRDQDSPATLPFLEGGCISRVSDVARLVKYFTKLGSIPLVYHPPHQSVAGSCHQLRPDRTPRHFGAISSLASKPSGGVRSRQVGRLSYDSCSRRSTATRSTAVRAGG